MSTIVTAFVHDPRPTRHIDSRYDKAYPHVLSFNTSATGGEVNIFLSKPAWDDLVATVLAASVPDCVDTTTERAPAT